MINRLNLPRYGLGNYIKPLSTPVPTTRHYVKTVKHKK